MYGKRSESIRLVLKNENGGARFRMLSELAEWAQNMMNAFLALSVSLRKACRKPAKKGSVHSRSIHRVLKAFRTITEAFEKEAFRSQHA